MNSLDRIADALERIATILEDYLLMGRESEAEVSPADAQPIIKTPDEHTLIMHGREFRSLAGLKALERSLDRRPGAAVRAWHALTFNLPIEDPGGQILTDNGKVLSRDKFERLSRYSCDEREREKWWVSTELLRQFAKVARTTKPHNYGIGARSLMELWLEE
jgi:hypothetical protein